MIKKLKPIKKVYRGESVVDIKYNIDSNLTPQFKYADSCSHCTLSLFQLLLLHNKLLQNLVS